MRIKKIHPSIRMLFSHSVLDPLYRAADVYFEYANAYPVIVTVLRKCDLDWLFWLIKGIAEILNYTNNISINSRHLLKCHLIDYCNRCVVTRYKPSSVTHREMKEIFEVRIYL